jgi:hypothetical protein
VTLAEYFSLTVPVERPLFVKAPPLRLPFDGTLSPDERRMLNQSTFGADE